MRRSLQCLSLILALTLLCCACAHSEKSAPTLSLYMDISTTDVESLAMVRDALDAYVYEKLGFHEIGRRKNYYRNPKEDALILRKEWEK